MSELMLVLGNKNYSSWSLRPWIFMRHFQLPFTEKMVWLFKDTTRDALEEYNSGHKVPVLRDGDMTVWDSLSILEYVSERYLQNRGWPADMQARAVARSISAEMHSSYVNLRNELPMNCRKKFSNIKLSGMALNDVERVTSIWRDCRREYGRAGKWLFGEFSAADAMFAPVALRFSGYSIDLGKVEQDYVDCVLEHPAIVEWIASGVAETEVIAEDEIKV